MTTYPRIVQVVIGTTDVRLLDEFYRELFGLEYRAVTSLPSRAWPSVTGRCSDTLLGHR